MFNFCKIFLAAIVVIVAAFAQDVITMQDGSEVQAVVVDVGVDEIRYKKYNFQEGPFFIVGVSKVFSIRYRNGEKEVFETKENASASARQTIYFPVYVPQYTAPAPAPTLKAPIPKAPVVKTESGRMFVFSTRGESLMGDIVGGGGTLELGVIGTSGFYFTVEGGGGGVYGGGGFNFGGTINKDGVFKNVIGVTVGNWFIVNLSYDFESVDSDRGYGGYIPQWDYENNYDYYHNEGNYDEGFNLGGVFWKLLLGKQSNFDITSKWLFGFKSGQRYDYVPAWRNPGYYEKYDHYGWTKYALNFTYSLSVGWTLTKKR